MKEGYYYYRLKKIKNAIWSICYLKNNHINFFGECPQELGCSYLENYVEIGEMIDINKEVVEKETINNMIESARIIQDFLWEDMNKDCGLEEFKRMLRKRLIKIEEINIENPHWKIELTKRLLQTAAICVNLITKIKNNKIIHNGIHPTLPSNLPEYSNKIKE